MEGMEALRRVRGFTDRELVGWAREVTSIPKIRYATIIETLTSVW